MKKKILIIISLFIMLISLSSCNNGLTYSYGYFRYKIGNESNEVMLMGLTKKGQQQETIVIPSEIKGKKVTTIGYPVWSYPGSYHWKCDFSSDNLKNIYFPSSLKYTSLDDDYFYNDLRNIKNVYIGTKRGSNLIFIGSTLQNNNAKIFVSNLNYSENDSYPNDYGADGTLFDYSYIKVANVVYYLNDDTEDTFFVDDCDGTIVNVTPPDPLREGYNFKGWYKEKECINKWDFENDIIPSKEYDSDGNYIFKETAIYASWEKE